MRWFLFGAIALAYVPLRAETPTRRQGLSDRELAIQRWFSSITFLQDRQQKKWPVWYEDNDQLGITSFRYQIAFAGYGCAAMAAKTPAYHELVQKQLDDLCRRLIDVRTWYYVTVYWNYGSDPPDPCRYDNVMYTGHLAELMCLGELLTGDRRYSESGWDFVWRDGRKTHYTLGKAVQRLHDLSVASATGGICCEPNLVFVVCNSHSAAAMMLFDLVHGTHFAEANPRWYNWMSKNFRKGPESRDFLLATYYQKPGFFVPVSDVGNDGWALGWGYPWFPTPTMAREGWEHVRKQAEWESPQPDQIYAKGNPLLGCCASGTAPMQNAFLPLLARQVEGAASPTARKLLRWFEATCGRAVDTDGDGHDDAYCYQTDLKSQIPVTGNLAAGLATDGPSLRELFRTSRAKMLAGPTLAHVDYPNVYVRAAEYVEPVLRFTVLKGRPGFRGTTELVCDHIPGEFTVRRDGEPYAAWRRDGGRVVISTDVDREHVFELTEWGGQYGTIGHKRGRFDPRLTARKMSAECANLRFEIEYT